MSWRKIALLGPYSGIPPGTLNSIYKGYGIPKKWRKRLGLSELKLTPACLKCGEVHLIDEFCTNETPVRIVKVRPRFIHLWRRKIHPQRKRRWHGWIDYSGAELKRLLEERIDISNV